jgi:hemerythrin-like domain-containing protein
MQCCKKEDKKLKSQKVVLEEALCIQAEKYVNVKNKHLPKEEGSRNS